MKLYELMNAGIEDELKKTGAGITDKTDSSPGMNPDGGEENPDQPDEQGAGGMGGSAGMDPGMGGLMGGAGMNQPDPGMQEQPDPEELERETKKVDDSLFTSVKDMPFVADYDSEKSKTGPYEILQMDNDELAQTRTIIRNKINQLTASDKYGMYDDPGLRYYYDMGSYIDRVISTKNAQAKNSNPNKSSSDPKPVEAKQTDAPKHGKPGEVKMKQT